jgi:hypothetical protein
MVAHIKVATFFSHYHACRANGIARGLRGGFPRSIHPLVAREHNVGSVRHKQTATPVHALVVQDLQLLQQSREINHDAIPQQVQRMLVQDARWQQVERKLLAYNPTQHNDASLQPATQNASSTKRNTTRRQMSH